MLWDQLIAPTVIGLPLFAAVYAAHGQAVGLVEEGDRSIVLLLAVLHDEVKTLVVRVNGKGPSSPVLPGITGEPVEAVLA
jgi:hypothetical protein